MLEHEDLPEEEEQEEEQEDEPWYEHEDCENCAKECEESNIEYEANFTWENGVWKCDNCGSVQ